MKRFTIYLITCLFALPVVSCSDDNDKGRTGFHVSTAPVTEITQTSAVTGGTVTTDGNAVIVARGVCWSKLENPTVVNDKTEDGNGIGDFVSRITELTPNVQYYVRAYVTSDGKTVYGKEITFTTLEAVAPSVTTVADVTDITDVIATSGGTITNEGSSAVTASGVCWSISENPTISDTYTTDIPENGTFVSQLTELQATITYYVRAYATSESGTGYGAQVSFKTEESFVPGYDEGISDLTGNINMPEMAGGGMMECYGNIYNEQTEYWGMILYNVGLLGVPDQQFYLEFHASVSDQENIPNGRYDIAANKDQGAVTTAEPGNVYKDEDWGCWYYADAGDGDEFIARASSVGNSGYVDIERTFGSGEEAEYDITVEFRDTHGYFVRGKFSGEILNFSASGTRAATFNYEQNLKMKQAKATFDAKKNRK